MNSIYIYFNYYILVIILVSFTFIIDKDRNWYEIIQITDHNTGKLIILFISSPF